MYGLRLLIHSVCFEWLGVQTDIRVLAETQAQPLLYIGGMLMSIVERNVARHTQVHLNRHLAAYAAGAQVMYAAHRGFTLGDGCYLLLYIGRQALLQQFVGGPRDEPCMLYV